MSQFEYVAVLISIIVGLALTQLLRGVGRMVTAKDGPNAYWVHLVWTFYLFINITLFWWWEFRLGTIEWSLIVYLVVIVYATLFFFASLVLQPGNLDGISSYEEYYFSNRRWIFGLLLSTILWDLVDTSIKGMDHLRNLGTGYIGASAIMIVGSIVAIITPNVRYHKAFAVIWMTAWLSFTIPTFFVIS